MEELEHLQTSEDSLQSFPVGRLVFAKVKGFPAWPAKVLAARLGSGCKYSVFFFGTQQTGSVRESHLWPYNESNAAKFCSDKLKKRPDFAKGMHQMNLEESGWEHDSVTKLKEVKVMLPKLKDAIRKCARDHEARVRMNSLPRMTGRAGEAGQQKKNGGTKKVAVKGGAMGKMKPKGKSDGCGICSKRFSMAGEVAVHTAEEHLKDLRINLLKTSLGQKNIKSRVSKGVAKKKMAGGGRVEVWEANPTRHGDVRFSKGIKSVGTKQAQIMAVENRKKYNRCRRGQRG